MKPIKPLALKASYTVEFSKCSARLVTLSRDVVVWDVVTRTKRFRSHPLSHPSSCAVHSQELPIAVKNTSGSIVVIDSEDGTLIRPLTAGRPGEGTNIAYSPCGEFLIDGTWAGLLAVRAVATGKIVFQTGFPGEMICQIVPNADKDTWFILHKPIAISRDVSGAPAYVSIWNWPFTAPAGFLTSPLADLWTLSLSPDGRRICMRGSQEIAIVDIAQKQPVAARSLIGGGTGFQTCWSPDAKELAIVTDGQVSFHDAGELEVRRTVAIPFASDVAYSSDGRFVALGSWQNGMLIDRTTPVAC